SLLRHPKSSSALEECAVGLFRRIIADPVVERDQQVDKILLCSGKIYYELGEERAGLGLKNIAIVRLDQLYPFPESEFKDALALSPDAKSVSWVQEEPENVGGWPYLHPQFCERVFGGLF